MEKKSLLDYKSVRKYLKKVILMIILREKIEKKIEENRCDKR